MAGVQPLKIAILAMGGEGGGVLANWIVDLGEHHGHIAQTTSVPGVAQRTGATIYYVELFSAAAAQAAGAAPVLALMPLPGDVDVVLASELMEAARAVQRGLVTPDRTTLVCSTHRVYAIAEKIALGDGRADGAALRSLAESAAMRFVGYDMAEAAAHSASVISAVMFGALAGTGVLPFTRAQFEATIERSGVGVTSSVRAFGVAYDRVAGPSPAQPGATVDVTPAPPRAADAGVQALLDRVASDHDGALRARVIEGLRRLVDYQDAAYGALYLDRLRRVRAVERGTAPASDALTAEVARHLALWMSYEDTIRVADLKTRATRFERVRAEVRAEPDQVLAIHDYLHPRLEEIADTLPQRLGRWLLASNAPRRLVQRLVCKGRVVRTSSLRGFALLSLVAAMRRWRRGTLRHAVENERIEDWLGEILRTAPRDLALALEIARCQNLVKGYGDTHERGLRNYATLRSAWQRGDVRLAAGQLADLRAAALADDSGHALQAALQRHALA